MTLTRPGVYSRCLPTPHGWVWIRVLADLRTIVAARLDDTLLWSAEAPAGLTLAHPDADAAPDGSIVVVAQAGSDDRARDNKLLVFTPQGGIETNLECSGIQGAVARWNGRAFVLFSKIRTGAFWRQELGQPAVEVSGLPGTADGWFDIQAGLARDGSQDVLWWADIHRYRTIHDFGLAEATTRGRFSFGQELSIADRLVGVLDDKTRVLVHEGLGKWPRLAVTKDGTEYAATWANLGGTVSVCLLPPWPTWVPAAPPRPVERPPIRRVTPTRRLHLFAEPDKPVGTGTWSYGPSSTQAGVKLPVLEGAGPPGSGSRAWADTIPPGHPIRALWWTRDENLTDADRAMAEAVALERSATIGVYDDQARFDGLADVTALRARGFSVRVLQQCYSGDDHTVAIAHIQTSLDALQAFTPAVAVDLLVRCDETTGWPADELDAMLAAVVDLANTYSCVSGIGVFHRGTLAGNRWPANRLAWWTQLIADNPAALPELVELPVEDKPADPGNTRPTHNGDGTNGKVAEWVAVGAAIAAVAVKAKAIGRFFKRLFS